MASFRTGFKIFGEISIKQGLGRIRSFSEDRKPGQWLPEDQWAVRHPGSTCPEPCDKPKKPPKPSKSWLSICKDPEVPIECDVRHSNCPPPPTKEEGPWYSLENFIPKKKPQETPPLRSCREEMRRREICGEEEEVCENIVDKTFTVDIKPEFPECCMPKQDPCPAPVVTLSCPLPKELDIMLWCGRPSRDTSRIAAKCLSDKLPYEEFRPQKCWKPPPFSLPTRPASYQPPPCAGSIPYSEFKQVDVPRPLYTRYKSVELSDANFLLCMIDAKCPDDETSCSLAIAPPPPPPCPCPPPCPQKCDDLESEKEQCPEKPIIQAGSCRPVRIKKAPKYTFRPKPTKLIERKTYRNPCAQHKDSNLPFRPADESDESSCESTKEPESCGPPKVFTGTLTDEPQTFERTFPLSCDPPTWMYVLCKPGSKKTPLVPDADPPKEPDWCSETDGLNFYDGNDSCLKPKPSSDPCVAKESATKKEETPAPEESTPVAEVAEEPPEFPDRFVLMPEQYNIKYTRLEDPCADKNECESATLEKFLEAKTSPTKKSIKSYPPIKENILYDLQRMCPPPPVDPTKFLNTQCRKPPEPECPQPPRFYRSYSTLAPSSLRNLNPIQLCKVPLRTECGDSSGKCKVRKLIPKHKDCPEKKEETNCAEITLPCCPKARIPPSCDTRKPLPPCKKKLPPKPSFSECSKDPPPCPRITECNCWEKKPGGKNRKFSDWAAVRCGTELNQTNNSSKPVETSRNSHLLTSLDLHSKEQYANRVKCSTLKPAQNYSGAVPENRVMLGLKDPTVDSSCEYEQRSIAAPRQNKVKKGTFLQKSEANMSSVSRRGDGPQTNHFLLQQQDAKREEMKGEISRDDEISLTIDNTPEHNEDNSKALIDSIGSWINDLFSVPNRKPNTSSNAETKPYKYERNIEKEREVAPEENSEYIKSINALTEQFRKKLQTETSVHISTGEKTLEFNFNTVSANDKKTKKESKSPRTKDALQEINDCLAGERPVAEKSPRENKRQERSSRSTNRKRQEGALMSPVIQGNALTVNNSILVKEKKSRKSRYKFAQLEEYVLPTTSELRKRLLLNINDQDKCTQLYKNSHLGMQEAQRYRKRKSKSNARCYTTDANLIENSDLCHLKSSMSESNKFMGSYFTSEGENDEISPKKISLDNRKTSLRNKTYRKEYLREMPMTGKAKSSKSQTIIQADLKRVDLKSSSDELVKYLMKKIKVTGRSQQLRKRTSAMTPVVTTNKNRIMQSATNSLVMSVLAKKENENQLPVKSVPRVSIENKTPRPDLSNKPFPSKEWPLRYQDSNMRFDIRRAANHHGFNKNTYLPPDDKVDDDMVLFEKPNYRNQKRHGDDPLKRDLKDQNDKFNKRQEVKLMLSKLDIKSNAIHSYKQAKQKEPKKKSPRESPEEIPESKEAQNARFQKQHELFKNNFKMIPKPESRSEQYDKEEEDDLNDATSLSTELAVIDPNLRLLPEDEGKSKKCDKASAEGEEDMSADADEDSDYGVVDYLTVDEKPQNAKNEKNKHAEKSPILKDNKLLKTKSLQYMKEEDSKVLLGSFSDYCKSEGAANPKEKVYEPAICSTDLRPVKGLDTIFLNRRYSTNSLNEPDEQKFKLSKDDETSKRSEEGKRDGKEKKRNRADAMENICGFEKTKKPAPNCDKDDFSP